MMQLLMDKITKLECLFLFVFFHINAKVMFKIQCCHNIQHSPRCILRGLYNDIQRCISSNAHIAGHKSEYVICCAGLEQWWRTSTLSRASRSPWTAMAEGSGAEQTGLMATGRWDAVRSSSSLSPGGCSQKTPAASTWSVPTAARLPSSSSSSVLQR